MAKIQIKRIYEEPDKTDGYRVLVDRLWPRGVSKERAALDEWAKDLAPSTELRKWFNHDGAKWHEFQSRYKNELAERAERLQSLVRRHGVVTLVHAARDPEHNKAVVLKKLLEGMADQ